MSIHLCLAPLEDRIAPAAADLDPTFGTRGKVVPGFVPSVEFRASDTSLLTNGKILVAGSIGSPGSDFAVVRLNPDGSLDPTFGTGGKAVVAFDLGMSDSDSASAIAVQPDGKIVLAGTVNTGDIESAFGVVRLTADGVLDPTFGSGGKLTVGFDSTGPDPYSSANDLVLQPDGKIVVVGTENHIVLTPPVGGTQFQSFAAIRLTADGKLDPTFGGDGRVTLTIGDRDRFGTGAVAVVLQPDGKVVLAGGAANNTQTDFAAARLNPDGSLDPSYGDGGTVIVPVSRPTPQGGVPRAAALRPDGSLLVAGSTRDSTTNDFDFAVALLTPDGRPDPAFGTGGVARVAFDLGQLNSAGAAGVLALPDGKVFLTGAAYIGNGNIDFAAVQLNADGSLDPTFDGDGRLVVPFDVAGTLADFATATALQPDGKIVVVGSAYTTGAPSSLAAVRLLGESAPVPLPPPPPPAVPGDLTGDGTADVVSVIGSSIQFVDGTTGATMLPAFTPFEASYTGGLMTAVTDLDGDGRSELVVAPGVGGGPRVSVYTLVGETWQVRANFFALDDLAFRGGVAVTTGDVNGDGIPDLVATAGPGGGPRVAVYDGRGLMQPTDAPPKLVADFFAFLDDGQYRNGVTAAVADLTGDGKADLAFGSGPGGAPRVFVLAGDLIAAGNIAQAQASPLANFFSGGDARSRGGSKVSLSDVNGDGRPDLTVTNGATGAIWEYSGPGIPGTPGEPVGRRIDVVTLPVEPDSGPGN